MDLLWQCTADSDLNPFLLPGGCNWLACVPAAAPWFCTQFNLTDQLSSETLDVRDVHKWLQEMMQDAPHCHTPSLIYRPNSLQSHLMQPLLHSQWLGNAFLLSVWALYAFHLCFFDNGAFALWLNYHPNLAGLQMTEGFMTNLQNRKWQEVPSEARGGVLFTPILHVWFQMFKMSSSVILESKFGFLYFTVCASLASRVRNCYLLTSVVATSKLGCITDLLSRSMVLILRLTVRLKGRQQQHRMLCVCH